MSKKELMEQAASLGIVGRSRMNKKQLEAAIEGHDRGQLDSIAELTNALSVSRRGRNFAVGTVIRWVNANLYLYAAIKTPVGWFTTARYTNSFVPQVVSFNELLDILKKDNTSDVEVSVKWEVVA